MMNPIIKKVNRYVAEWAKCQKVILRERKETFNGQKLGVFK